MKKKALVLAVCMAITAPNIGVAQVLPHTFTGISLGEIQAESFLSEPFRGFIPILFSDIKSSNNLKIRLASKAMFNKVGVEKLPLLNNLRFQIKTVNKKPLIVISSEQSIQVPFLSFVLEIESPEGRIYQDYTTLLDPKSQTINRFAYANSDKPISTTLANEDSTQVVKSGDTLSEIAQALSTANISLKKMISAIHKRNPNAFVKNDINRLKAGAVLHIPNPKELRSSAFNKMAKVAIEKKHLTSSKNLNVLPKDAYKVRQGDTLSNITKKYGHKDISFTKMMKEIHSANPHAFSKNKINLLKVGKILRIPSLEELTANPITIIQHTSGKAIPNFVDPNLIILSDEKNIETASEFNLNGFVIERGDTLSNIATQIGHKGIPHSDMMKAIYIANPDAFESNNITMLIEGAIIRLPSIAEIKGIKPDNSSLEIKDKKSLSKPENLENNESSNNLKTSNNIAFKNLEKRVRELKRDLQEAGLSFSNLESTLIKKEALIEKQSDSLQELAASLASLKTKQLKPTKVSNTKKRAVRKKEIAKKNKHLPVTISQAEAVQPLTMEEELLAARTGKSYIPNNFSDDFTKKIKSHLATYGVYMSGKELLSTILALLLGLLLIRYRREIYSYTNISYDHPKYYPPLNKNDAKKILKEKSIIFNDDCIDSHDSITQFSGKQIEECEDLVEELIDDLNIETNVDKNTNWDDLNKACDEYISEFKNEDTDDVLNFKIKAVEQAKTNEMTFELFEALAKGDIKNKKSSTIDDATIYNLQDDTKEHFDGIPPIFSDLVELSEKK